MSFWNGIRYCDGWRHWFFFGGGGGERVCMSFNGMIPFPGG